MKVLRWTNLLLVALLGILAVQPEAMGQSRRGVDWEKAAKVKSAFLVNFIKFTQWPDESFTDKNSPMVIAVVGEDEMQDILVKSIDGKQLNNRQLKVIVVNKPAGKDDSYYASGDLAESLQGAHLVYLTETAAKHTTTILKHLKDDVLTVGDTADIARKGSMLALDINNGKVAPYANMKSIKDSKLKISSKLLQLATSVD